MSAEQAGATAPERTYRLAPRDRTGWVLGLSGPQVMVLGTALVVAVLGASRVGVTAAMAALVAGVAVAFARVRGRPVLEAAPPAARWLWRSLRHRTAWEAPDAEPPSMPPGGDLDDGDGNGGVELMLPPPWDGQRLLGVDPAPYDPGLDDDVAVVHDPRGATFMAALAVAAAPFALTERAEQERLLARWGDALAGFCVEGGPVVAVRWIEWAAPAGLDDQADYLARHGHGDLADPAYASYRALLSRAGPLATRHSVVVTVTVSAHRVAAGRRHRGDVAAACVEALLAQLRLFAARLDAAGLAVGTPLSPAELVALVASRLDPDAADPASARPRTLAERAGHRRATAPWPTRAEARPGHVGVGGSVHRAWYVAEWPRLDVGPDWLGPLVLAAGAVRTIAVVAEPVPPRRSRRAIERDATKLASDEEHRRSKGFRVSAAHRRAADDVAEREAQLVCGFGELAYAGIVSVAAADPEALERAATELTQVAAGCGLELAPLEFRHDQGVGACLPLARALAPGRSL